MLPVINLSVTNMIALHSLLFLEVVHRKNNKLPTPSITCDQTLYVKVCETVIRNKTKIFACLGCFHQLKRLLGSIGSLMERSGIRRALETVYAPVIVNLMMTGKAYTLPVYGHMMPASAALS